MSLPHRYPFRWLDPPGPDAGTPDAGTPDDGVRRLRVRLSAGAHAPRQNDLSPIVALEILAQAAASTAALPVPETAPVPATVPVSEKPVAAAGVRSTTGGEQRPGLLAAIDAATFAAELAQRPLGPGDELDVEVERTASFGRLLKVRGSISRRGVVLIEAQLVVATAG